MCVSIVYISLGFCLDLSQLVDVHTEASSGVDSSPLDAASCEPSPLRVVQTLDTQVLPAFCQPPTSLSSLQADVAFRRQPSSNSVLVAARIARRHLFFRLPLSLQYTVNTNFTYSSPFKQVSFSSSSSPRLPLSLPHRCKLFCSIPCTHQVSFPIHSSVHCIA